MATGTPGLLDRIVAPALHGVARDMRARDVAARFAQTVRLEAILLLAVLLCSALLRQGVPARHAAHNEHAGVALRLGWEPESKGDRS